MATQFEIDCALMSGRAYQLTRAEINLFPVPSEWTELFHVPNDAFPTTDCFEAVSFQRGTEIVIAFTGTDPSDLAGDWAANAGLANGFGSAQLRQAADYYLDARRPSRPPIPGRMSTYQDSLAPLIAANWQ